MVLEKTLESPLDSNKIKPVNPKRNQPYISIGRTDAEVEAPILWPPDAKSQLIGKDPDAGKDWRQKKWTTEDKMVRWHHCLSMDMSLSKVQAIVKDREAWCAAFHGVAKSWTQLSKWTTTNEFGFLLLGILSKIFPRLLIWSWLLRDLGIFAWCPPRFYHSL